MTNLHIHGRKNLKTRVPYFLHSFPGTSSFATTSVIISLGHRFFRPAFICTFGRSLVLITVLFGCIPNLLLP